jgi:transcriptional regulator with XRE-family HTH domain
MSEQESQPKPPHSELATFGEELKREREIRGISLKEIADATKISKRFLEAIERNDHKTLPAPVFTRGFVREYARYLGLNADEMVNRYNYAAAGDDRIEKPPPHPIAPPLAETPKKVRAKRGIPPAMFRVDFNLLMLLLIAVALAAVAWWAVQFKQRRDAEARAAETSAPIVAAAKTAVVPPTATTPPPGDDMLRLALEARQNCWVELQADGSRVVYDELRAGDKRTFEAKESFHFVKIGKADALSLTLNGVEAPVPADKEPVRDFTLNRESLQVLRSTPNPQP